MQVAQFFFFSGNGSGKFLLHFRIFYKIKKTFFFVSPIIFCFLECHTVSDWVIVIELINIPPFVVKDRRRYNRVTFLVQNLPKNGLQNDVKANSLL